jgi:hypothetical protein
MAAIDIAGFIEAQANLRVVGGAPVIFKVPTAPTWPEGTKINPITGLPYDATVKQENAAWTEVTKTCLVILKQGSPLRPQSDTDVVALGEVSGMDIILDIAQSDYEDVETAKEMHVNGLDYSIREAKPFSLGGQVYRQLVYGEQL